MGGEYVKDPNGWHATIAYKDRELERRGFSITAHGYTYGQQSFTLRKAIPDPPQRDDAKRGGKNSKKILWPGNNVDHSKNPVWHYHPLGNGASRVLELLHARLGNSLWEIHHWVIHQKMKYKLNGGRRCSEVEKTRLY